MKRTLMAQGAQAMKWMLIGGGMLAPQLVHAQDTDDSVKLETVTVEGQVVDLVDLIPTEPVDSVFGFNKSLLETPRSVTTISNEMMNKFNISELDDLVALSPGSFTQSFFGVAGSLDVRGTNGEVYFRGVRRIENPGNYPTPIGASDRIDIVRGPASPIYGPSRIGGYLNFVPKSARAENGAYMKEPRGQIEVTHGSWDKDVITGEVGGPGSLGGQDFGYYLYAQVEDSGSYYENSSTDQSIYQASFNADLSDATRIEFGGMYQNFEGNQVAGWNRLTQDLIDHGTYITGSPPSLDTNGDGLMSAAEAEAGVLSDGWYNGTEVSGLNSNTALVNPGTTHLKGSQVLVQQDDELTDKVTTLYFDVIHDFESGLNLHNKSFYEDLDNNNENAYGFSQYAQTWAFEDQLIFAYDTQHTPWLKGSYQFSPSIRYQDFEHGDNFEYEYFDRRDISKPGSPIDRRTLSTRDGAEIEPWSSHTFGNYTDFGAAVLADFTAHQTIDLLLGARYDSFDMESRCGEYLPNGNADSVGCDETTPIGEKQTDTDDAFSWSTSLSWNIAKSGVIPYVTIARQSTLVTGQGGQIPAELVASGSAVGESKLDEYGVKGSLFGGRLYTTLDYFKQQRTDYNAQDTVTNNTTLAEGWEFEFRSVLTDNLSMTGAYSNTKVYNVPKGSAQFSFAGAEDVMGVIDPSEMFGGVTGLYQTSSGSRKAGIPENIYSLYFIYNFTGDVLNGLTATLGATHVDSVYSGWTKQVKLPSYTLVNAGLSYDTRHWGLSLQGKNLTDERYFRSNFPDLFGGSVVLPELPRNYMASLSYKF